MNAALNLKSVTEQGLYHRVSGLLKKKLKGAALERYQTFAAAYFEGCPADEFNNDMPDRLVEHLEDVLAFFDRPLSKKPDVRVHNPRYSPHTVVQINMPDQPFLVDSVWTELNRMGIEIHHTFHPILFVKRDKAQKVTDFSVENKVGYRAESLIHVECDRQSKDELAVIAKNLNDVLAEAQATVKDFPAMTARMQEVISKLQNTATPDESEHKENLAFLEWLLQGHFIFLGYRTYDMDYRKGGAYFTIRRGSGLGILVSDKASSVYEPTPLNKLAPNIARYLQTPETLTITKALNKARVHRSADMDYIGVKEFDSKGRVVCEHRFVGLFTSRAYSISTREIPLVRRKIAAILEAEAGHAMGSHNSRALANILETYPRDELFQISAEQLHQISRGILHLKERQQTRLFVRPSMDERLISALVFLPRDRLTRIIRTRISRILSEAYQAEDVEYNIHVGDSLLARIFFKLRVREGAEASPDVQQLEEEIVRVTRSWEDGIRRLLVATYGEQDGLQLFKKYGSVFRAGYQEDTSAEVAVSDIAFLERLEQGEDFLISIYQGEEADTVHLKIFRNTHPLLLSDIMPIFEKMGLYVMEESANQVALDSGIAWLHDFKVRTPAGIPSSLTEDALVNRITESMQLAWRGTFECDSLNKLVIWAGLGAEAIVMLRAYVAYFQQVGTRYSQDYVRTVLTKYPHIAARLWKLFDARFNPAHAERKRKTLVAEIEDTLQKNLRDDVSVLDEDIILRTLRDMVLATVRTNAFARNGDITAPLAFKVVSNKVPGMPKPHPLFEIYVYHSAVEGIHLRGGKVARGGLRWSDRVADFRTEVLGLMKTQMTKNSVIIPVGSKGGFVLKKAPCDLKDIGSCDRDELKRAVKDAYTIFITCLLSVTDNLIDGKVVPPQSVVRHDEDDPYLVVAADKGTATFSDTANGIAIAHGFWLDDAFASGGSNGYDHKKMGITARGAWECVKRHFRELGVNTQKDEFTVAGIGDMGGDVFGNGMLRSDKIRLQAAYNHLHIFIDPNPDAAKSFAERKRLFNAEYGGWDAYDAKLISKGGGVFKRSDKSITLTPEMKTLLKLNQASATPNEVISAILKMQVDLLWNGGIGTFLKASTQDNSEVGDRANDDIRINGKDVRARVIGEGGNLGCTQLGRIEYAQRGGLINTDAVDNSAGVDCSDHEVNIKILLAAAVKGKKLSKADRNKLLVAMTDDVAALVLRDNYLQSQLLSFEVALRAVPSADTHRRMISHLEKKGMLERTVEYLPADEDFKDRIKNGHGLTRPEMAVLMAYVKMDLFNSLVASDLPDDPALEDLLFDYFPQVLQKKFAAEVRKHPLRREIIATVVANELVNRMGLTFIYRLRDETGFSEAVIARAFILASKLYNLADEWKNIEALDNKVPAFTQLEMLDEVRLLAEHIVVWFLRNGRVPLSIEGELKQFAGNIATIKSRLMTSMTDSMKKRVAVRESRWQKAGLDKDTARNIALLPNMRAAQDVAQTATATKQDVSLVMDLHFQLGECLHVDLLQNKVRSIPATNYWQRIANQTLMENLYAYQKDATSQVLGMRNGKAEKATATIGRWVERKGQALETYGRLVDELHSHELVDHAMLNVALGHLKSITA